MSMNALAYLPIFFFAGACSREPVKTYDADPLVWRTSHEYMGKYDNISMMLARLIAFRVKRDSSSQEVVPLDALIQLVWRAVCAADVRIENRGVGPVINSILISRIPVDVKKVHCDQI